MEVTFFLSQVVNADKFMYLSLLSCINCTGCALTFPYHYLSFQASWLVDWHSVINLDERKKRTVNEASWILRIVWPNKKKIKPQTSMIVFQFSFKQVHISVTFQGFFRKVKPWKMINLLCSLILLYRHVLWRCIWRRKWNNFLSRLSEWLRG